VSIFASLLPINAQATPINSDRSNFFSRISSNIETDSKLRILVTAFLKNSLQDAEKSTPVISESTDSGTIQNWVSELGELALALKVASYAESSSYSSTIRTGVRNSLGSWSSYRTILLNAITNRLNTGLSQNDFLQYWSEAYRSKPVIAGGLGVAAFKYDLEWDAAVTGIAELYQYFPVELSSEQQTLVLNRLRTELQFFKRVTTCRRSFSGVATPSDCSEVTGYASTPYIGSFSQNHGFNIYITGLRMAEALIAVDGSDAEISDVLTIVTLALTETAQSLSPDGSPLEGASFGYFMMDLGIPKLLKAFETLKNIDSTFASYLSSASVRDVPDYLLCALYPDLLGSPAFSDAASSLSFIQALIPSPWLVRYLATTLARPDLLWILSELERRYSTRYFANISFDDLVYHDATLSPPESAPAFTRNCYFPNRGLVFSRNNESSDSTMVAFEAANPLGDWLEQRYAGINCATDSACKTNPGHASAKTGIFEIYSGGKVLAVLPPYTTDKRTEHYPGTVVGVWNGTAYDEAPSLLQTSRPNESLWSTDTASRFWAYIKNYFTHQGDAHVLQSEQRCFYGNPQRGYVPCNEVSDEVSSECALTGGCSSVNYDFTSAETAKSYDPAGGLTSYVHMFLYIRELDCVLRSESLSLDTSLPYVNPDSGVPNRILRSRIQTIPVDSSLASSVIKEGDLYLVKSTGGGIIVGDLTPAEGSYTITPKTLQDWTDTDPGVRWPASSEALTRKTRLEFLREVPVTSNRASFLHLLCPSRTNDLSTLSVSKTDLGQGKQELVIQRETQQAKFSIDPANDRIEPIAWIPSTPTPTPTPEITRSPKDTPIVTWTKKPKRLKERRKFYIKGSGIISGISNCNGLIISYSVGTSKKVKNVKPLQCSSRLLNEVSFKLKIPTLHGTGKITVMIHKDLDQIWRKRI